MAKLALSGLETIEVTTKQGEFKRGGITDILSVTFDGRDSWIDFTIRTGPEKGDYEYVVAWVRDIKVVEGKNA